MATRLWDDDARIVWCAWRHDHCHIIGLPLRRMKPHGMAYSSLSYSVRQSDAIFDVASLPIAAPLSNAKSGRRRNGRPKISLNQPIVFAALHRVAQHCRGFGDPLHVGNRRRIVWIAIGMPLKRALPICPRDIVGTGIPTDSQDLVVVRAIHGSASWRC